MAEEQQAEGRVEMEAPPAPNPGVQAEYEAALVELGQMPEEEAAPAQAAAPATEPPAVAAPASPPPADPPPDEKTARRLQLIMQREAEAKRAADTARSERQQLANERAAKADSEKKLAEYDAAMAKFKTTGDVGALLRAHGLDPSRDLAEDVLVEAMGKDAPPEMRLKAQNVQLARRLEAIEQREAQRERDAQSARDRMASEQQEAQVRLNVRTQIIPTLGDDAAAVLALADDPEYGEVVVNAGIQKYRAMEQETGIAPAPAEAFKYVHQRMVRLGAVLMSHPAVAREIAQAIEAKKPKPTTTAEETKPAPPKTLSNKLPTSSTRQQAPRSMKEEYEAALDELRELPH